MIHMLCWHAFLAAYPLLTDSAYIPFPYFLNKTDIGYKCTLIFVSHRLGVTKLCNRILVLDKDAIGEQGGHKQLMCNKNLYYQMNKKQSDMYI